MKKKTIQQFNNSTMDLLGIKIDYVTMDQVIGTVEKWLKSRGKHYVVTPNPEMLVDAQSDPEFKLALNKADLSLPDSSRLGWASLFLVTKNPLIRLVYLPLCLLPNLITSKSLPTVAGTDLMEKLISLSEEKAFTTAFLGGTPRVADRLFKCLTQKYPKLKIRFCSGNIKVNEKGESRFDIDKNNMTVSKKIKLSDGVIPDLIRNPETKKTESRVKSGMTNNKKTEVNAHVLSQKIDILFVAFGHKKQEKWMHTNLPKLNVRVMVGVGGAFDYLSGSVPRAPQFMRALGLEWLFRFMVQPWRIKRFWKLPVFVYKVMTCK